MFIEIDKRSEVGRLEKEAQWAASANALHSTLDEPSFPSPPEFIGKARPLVDVLVPAFNAENVIRQALESVFRQDYPCFRLIIVDDGSTDGTADVIRGFRDELQPILLVRQENSGIVEALNEGLRYVSAPFTARIDADDYSFPRRFTDQVNFLQENASYIAVSSAFYEIDEDGRLNGRRYVGQGLDVRHNFFAYPAFEPYLPHSLLMMRTSVIKSLGYRHVHHSEDVDLFWRAQRFGRLATLSDIHGCYRVHTASVSGANVVEGRIQAVFSQLAALSARRVVERRPDLDFNRAALAEARVARDLERIAAAFESRLTSREYAYLRSASAIKLAEFSLFRPYALEASDITLLLDAVDLRRMSSGHERRSVRSMIYRCVRKFVRNAPTRTKLWFIYKYPWKMARAFIFRGRRP
ncbi:MAG: glycosyltransferase family A protein [Roseiarcus sp.]